MRVLSKALCLCLALWHACCPPSPVAGAWQRQQAAAMHARQFARQQRQRHVGGGEEPRLKAPAPSHAGFLDVDHARGTKMYYAFYEAQEENPSIKKKGLTDTTPIVLWLQGGPGCSSLFGMLYINGPYFINEDDLSLSRNPGSWNRLYGMLFVDQPLGVGFSSAEEADMPKDELAVARDLFQGLQSFYRQFPKFQDRPLIVTGESYAGKYVPSISHYVLQMDMTVSGRLHEVKHPRPVPAEDIQDPLFELGGLAIGNGFTDAVPQTLVQADVAWAFGLIDLKQKRQAEALQVEVVDLVYSNAWKLANQKSDELNAFITNASWTATLEDVRRNIGYDGPDVVTTFLNQAHVKDALQVTKSSSWESCSAQVNQRLSGDIMKSVRVLVQDLLSFHPVLLYQGQYDAECGVASNDAWVSTMTWTHHVEWMNTDRGLWLVNNRAAGFWKQVDRLRNVVLRNTGHMVPHDNPLIGQLMIEKWIEEEVVGSVYTRDQEVTPDLERSFANPDQGQEANPKNWKNKGFRRLG